MFSLDNEFHAIKTRYDIQQAFRELISVSQIAYLLFSEQIKNGRQIETH